MVILVRLDPDFTWEQTDMTETLKKEAERC